MADSHHTVVTDPHPVVGKLTFESIPYHDPVLVTTFFVVIIGSLGLLGAITYFGKWKVLWQDWFTSVDLKKIGIMYIITAFIMLIRGFSDALLMRSQQAMAVASESGAGYLPPEHYDQIFTQNQSKM